MPRLVYLTWSQAVTPCFDNSARIQLGLAHMVTTKREKDHDFQIPGLSTVEFSMSLQNGPFVQSSRADSYM
jgi:hypothetical protein